MSVVAVEVLVLRAYVEPAGQPKLRVRVAAVVPGRPSRQVLSTASVEAACNAVRSWLMSIEAQAPPAGPVTHP